MKIQARPAGTNRIHSDESTYLRLSPCTFIGHFVQQCSEVRHGNSAFFKVFFPEELSLRMLAGANKRMGPHKYRGDGNYKQPR